MSLTFRQVNKFVSILSISVPKSHKFQHSLAVKQSTIIHQEISDPYKSLNNAFSDNRELLSDVIRREQVYSLDSFVNSLGLARFSQQPAPNIQPPNSENNSPNTVLSNSSNNVPTGRPSPEKLYVVYEQMAKDFPNFFYQTLDYSKYHANIVFEDNIRNLRTEGIYPYIKQMALIRIVGHLKFAYVKMEILKITMHPEDGTIKVRWRITGVSGLKVMLRFWKYKPWEYRKTIEKAENWYDGFSTFVVNSEGFVVKHVAEKMMPDDDRLTERSSTADLGAAKLALIVGLLPKFADFTTLI